VYGGILAASDLDFAIRGGTVGATFVNGTVVGVLPGSPADRAGIREGDRADLAAADLRARMFITRDIYMFQGERLTVPIVSGGGTTERSIVAMATPPLGRSELLLLAIASIAYVLLAAWVVVGSGTITGYALAAFCVGQLQTAVVDVFGPLTLPLCTLINVIAAIGPLGLVIFALHAGDERLTRSRAVLQALAVIATVPLVLGAISETLISVVFPGHAISIVPRYVSYAPSTFTAAALLILLARYIRNPEVRVRIAWLLPAMLILLIFIYPQPAYNNSFVLGTAINALPLLAIVCLVYAILKSHLIDVRFVVSRAVVYGSLTSAALALIGLLDWALGGVLASSQLALPIEALTAIGIGFWLNALHGRVENLVEAVLFRTRRRVEERLARVSRGLERSDDASLIRVALVTEAASALELASAALFVRADDGTFARTSALGWQQDHVALLEPHDPFVLQVAGADAPFRLEGSSGIAGAPEGHLAKPRLAVPVRSRGVLVAFTLYGSHAGGADLDPAEMQLLARLADAASYDYDRAEAARLRAVVARLEAALAALDPDYAGTDTKPSLRSRSGSGGAAAAGAT
jgi:hypothetical protein